MVLVRHSRVPSGAFQSLSGFLMSCNEGAVYDMWDESKVSIPIGFSNEL